MLEPSAIVSLESELGDSQLSISRDILIFKKSSINNTLIMWFQTSYTFSRSLSLSSSLILFNLLLNIHYSFSLRKRFYALRRLSFNYLIQAILLVASQVASILISFYLSFFIALLILLKLITSLAGLYFFLVRIYSLYFQDREDS